jgi:23S rRNA (uracil1939-C5)-methyltransferase
VAAADCYSYRSRLQFKVSVSYGVLHVGFYRHGSHQVVDVPDICPVAVPAINRVLGCFRALLSSYPGVEAVSGLRMDAGDNGVVVIITQAGKVTSGQKRFLNARIRDCDDCTGLYVAAEGRPEREKILGGSELLYCMSSARPGRPPLQLTYPPGGFAQVHQRQNAAMLAVIRMLGAFTPAGQLLDLYCGNGNFSLPLADEVALVTGIEGSADSIRAAERNRAFNKVANIQFICDDAATGVGRLVDEGRTFDTVLLDPPRAGAEGALAGIISLKPERIIYVSCDPNTLARDCGILAGAGYQVVRSVPVDMFPQTYHIESVTLLTC